MFLYVFVRYSRGQHYPTNGQANCKRTSYQLSTNVIRVMPVLISMGCCGSCARADFCCTEGRLRGFEGMMRIIQTPQNHLLSIVRGDFIKQIEVTNAAMHEILADWLHLLASLHGCSDSERQAMVKVNGERTDYEALASMTIA